MVIHSPYKKALNLTAMITIFGVIFFLVGLSQMATLPGPNWILVIMGLITGTVGSLLFRWVEKSGKKHLSTTGYRIGKPFEDVSFEDDFR